MVGVLDESDGMMSRFGKDATEYSAWPDAASNQLILWLLDSKTCSRIWESMYGHTMRPLAYSGSPLSRNNATQADAATRLLNESRVGEHEALGAG